VSDPGPSDEALLAAHLRGDRRAFATLVSRHERRVYGLCLRLLGNREDAEDATQEAFLAALRHAAGFRHTAAFSTWLYRIAVNAATDQARRRARVRSVPLVEEGPGLPVAPAVPDAAEGMADTLAVQAALTRVPLEFRVALVLCDLYQLPTAQAAEILGVPVGTVKSRAFRGRLALAALLAESEEGRGPERAKATAPLTGTGPAAATSEPREPQRHRPDQE
jgi:RNA polymerase sigma-70 factor (ECF subfamily)